MQVNALNLFLKPFGAEAVAVGREDYHRPLEWFLTGEKAGSFSEVQGAGRGEALPARMLVFCNFPGEELDQLLQVCPGCGITKNDLKAVLTPVNRSFNGEVLFKMLMEEHRQFQK